MTRKSWPRWSENLIKSKFPQTSLLAGTEPAVWYALGRLALKDFDDGKQVVVRKALEDIGLGWVATNTTPFRIAIGGLFDAAEKVHRQYAKKKTSDDSNLKSNRKSTPSIYVHTQQLPEAEHNIIGPVKKSTANKANRVALWDHMQSYGAYVIRKAVAASSVQTVTRPKQAKETKLSRSMGNGIAGNPPGIYMDLHEQPDWHDVLEQNIGKLLIGEGAPGELSETDSTLKRKSVLLLTGENAENWAHQDNNDEVPPVQAMVMLSEPRKDFAGGEFYVARQTKNMDNRINIVRYKITFESPGDLVIFIAGKGTGWWHGMLPVKAGDTKKQEHEYLRRAVGMLQR